MLRILWRFRAKLGRVHEFRRVYGSEGLWAKFFAKSAEYQGTVLLQDTSDPLSFVTIDSWASQGAFVRFRAQFAGEYEALDQQCSELTDAESLIGSFEDATS